MKKEYPMHCPMCARVMLSLGSQTIEEATDTLTITSWRCHPCDQLYEEILASKGNQGMQRQRLVYRVRSVKLPALEVIRQSSRARRNQAHAVLG